jgi:hypothetical protein
MNPLDDLFDVAGAPDDDGIALMAELVGAVTWLRRGAMPGLTVWDAMEHALRLRSGTEVDWHETDPFRTALQSAINEPAAPLAHVFDDALRWWLAATCDVFNDGIEW